MIVNFGIGKGRHRGDDLPAVIRKNGTKKWYWKGKLHRNNGKPAIIWVGDGAE